MKRCIVCGRRLRWWQLKFNVKESGTPRMVHLGRFYAGTTRTCMEVFAISVEAGMADVFVDTKELT